MDDDVSFLNEGFVVISTRFPCVVLFVGLLGRTRKDAMYIDTALKDGGGPERLGRKDTH